MNTKTFLYYVVSLSLSFFKGNFSIFSALHGSRAYASYIGFNEQISTYCNCNFVYSLVQ